MLKFDKYDETYIVLEQDGTGTAVLAVLESRYRPGYEPSEYNFYEDIIQLDIADTDSGLYLGRSTH